MIGRRNSGIVTGVYDIDAEVFHFFSNSKT